MQHDQPDIKQLKQLNRASQQQALRFVIAQLCVTITISAIAFVFDATVFYSALVGGLIATTVNAWFVLKVFQLKTIASTTTLLTTVYVGEIYKFTFTSALFIIAFVLMKPLNIVALLGAYFLVHMTPAVQNAFGKQHEFK